MTEKGSAAYAILSNVSALHGSRDAPALPESLFVPYCIMQPRQFDKESKQLGKRRKERELVVRAVLDNVTLAQRKMVG